MRFFCTGYKVWQTGTRNMRSPTAAEPGSVSAYYARGTVLTEHSTLWRHCAQYSTCRVSISWTFIKAGTFSYQYFAFWESLLKWHPHMGLPTPVPAFAEEALTATDHVASYLVGKFIFRTKFRRCGIADAGEGIMVQGPGSILLMLGVYTT